MKKLFAIAAFLICSTCFADEADRLVIEQEAATFFDNYLEVYNRRFGYPEKGQQFRSEINAVVNMPVLQSPPTSAPFVTDSREDFGRNFEGFLMSLEQKGVTQLVWYKTSFHILSPKKVLANNIGHGIDDDGKVIYETISLYLLVCGNDGWRISLFSPYLVENELLIESSL
ncbi:MAG: hypothetical protein AAFX56_06390 [Pseudomonadota bacterium]